MHEIKNKKMRQFTHRTQYINIFSLNMSGFKGRLKFRILRSLYNRRYYRNIKNTLINKAAQMWRISNFESTFFSFSCPACKRISQSRKKLNFKFSNTGLPKISPIWQPFKNVWENGQSLAY